MRVVWLVDIRKRTVRVHTAVDQSVLIKKGQTLDGGAVLPGFVLRSTNCLLRRPDRRAGRQLARDLRRS